MSIMKLQGEKERAEGIYYEVDPARQPIGIGGMGRVYKGMCVNEFTRELKPVAIKFMFEDAPETTVNRARREASIQLRNDNLIEMLGFIETNDRMGNDSMIRHYHVVSELLHGVTLSDVLEGRDVDFEGKSIPFATKMYQLYLNQRESFALIIIKNVLSGLMALHDDGYIHRDIDPSNIMLTDDEHIKLIDFGIAKRMNMLEDDTVEPDSPCQKERLVGKMKYAAPELVRSDVAHQNLTTDIYAVGVLLYQLLCGHLPFEGTMQEVMEKQLRDDIPLNEIANPVLRSIVKKATEKKQERRFQSTSEFRAALDAMPVISPGNQTKSAILPLLIVALLGIVLGICLAFL